MTYSSEVHDKGDPFSKLLEQTLLERFITTDCTIERGPQIGTPFKVPSYLVHPLVVPSIRFQCI